MYIYIYIYILIFINIQIYMYKYVYMHKYRHTHVQTVTFPEIILWSSTRMVCKERNQKQTFIHIYTNKISNAISACIFINTIPRHT